MYTTLFTPLSAPERDLLFWMLPLQSPAYAAMMQRLEQLDCYGDANSSELLFCDSKVDRDNESVLTPVFAIAVLQYPHRRVTMTVHEESDRLIVVRIAPRIRRNGEAEISRWSLSHWLPGNMGPESGTFVRHIPIADTDFILALCPEEKRLWIHDTSSVFNMLLPTTAIYNHLMQYLGIREPKRVLSPERLYTEHTVFSDSDMINALQRYGARSGRFQITGNSTTKQIKLTLLRRLFTSFKRHA